MKLSYWIALIILILLLPACQPAGQLTPPPPGTPRVVAVESFLADIAQNVAGERLAVETLMPSGMDPHTFEPAPRDVASIAESQVLIVNGAGFEEWLGETLANAGGQRLVIEASAGLQPRQPGTGELAGEHSGSDPHFWLDPNLVMRYAENIRDGLIQVDPAGAQIYTQNAAAYIARLQELDAWARQLVEQIPPNRRLLVTNHENLGYFADRYGFEIVGAVIPGVSSAAVPSARQLAGLVDTIKATHARAIFLETGANPELAEQVAEDSGAKLVTGLFTHSLSEPGGPAPTYLDMIRYNVNAIVEALK